MDGYQHLSLRLLIAKLVSDEKNIQTEIEIEIEKGKNEKSVNNNGKDDNDCTIRFDFPCLKIVEIFSSQTHNASLINAINRLLNWKVIENRGLFVEVRCKWRVRYKLQTVGDVDCYDLEQFEALCANVLLMIIKHIPIDIEIIFEDINSNQGFDQLHKIFMSYLDKNKILNDYTKSQSGDECESLQLQYPKISFEKEDNQACDETVVHPIFRAKSGSDREHSTFVY